jgi:hypothetical protein
MAFHFHTVEEVNERLRSYNVPLKPEYFGRRDEFQQDHLTEVGRDLLVWFMENQVTNFYKGHRWENPIEQIAVLGFGADYNLFKEGWNQELTTQLDDYYGPLRCNAYLPQVTGCAGFDGSVLNAIGVYHIYSPEKCATLSHLGRKQPFVALFAELYSARQNFSARLNRRLEELVADPDDRDLLCRYDALHHALGAAYKHSYLTQKHLLMTNRWPG